MSLKLLESPLAVPSRIEQKCIYLILAAVVYQCVLVNTHGIYSQSALMICLLVLLLPAIALLMPFTSTRTTFNKPTIIIGLIGIIVQGIALIQHRREIYFFPISEAELNSILICSSIMIPACLLAVFVGRFSRKILVAFVTLLLIYLCFGRIMLTEPRIDVWLFHQDSATAFLKGINPYSITFKNMYGFGTQYYSPEVQQGDRVLFGFPYPPMSFFMYLPSYLVSGESRYAHALAFSFAGAIVTTISRGKISLIAGLLLLMAPASTAVIESAWTEPFLMLWLAIVAWAAIKKPMLLPYTLGIFLSLKQYTVIFFPLLFIILPRPLSLKSSTIFISKIILTIAIVSLPLALWNWAAFWNSNVTIQVKQPFRYDALSYLAMFGNFRAAEFEATHPGQFFSPPSWWSMIPFLSIIPVWAIAIWKSPRNIAGFLISLSLTLVIFLFLNRQAFLNYHTLGACSMLIAVAALEAVYGTVQSAAAKQPATAPNASHSG